MGTAEFLLGAEVCVGVGKKEKRVTRTHQKKVPLLRKNGVCYIGVREIFINKVAFEQRMTHMGRLRFLG